MKSYRKQKIKLFRKGKSCFYCGVETVLAPSGEDLKYFADNIATVDHYYSKHDIRRLLPKGAKKLVLCCRKCNQLKNERELTEVQCQKEYAQTKNYKVIDIDSFIQHQKLSNGIPI